MKRIDTHCVECGVSFIWKGDRLSRFYTRNNKPVKHFCGIECKNRYHGKLMKLNNPMQGRRHSQAMKEFVSRLNTGRKLSSEQARRKREGDFAQRGKKYSLETRRKISEGNLGKSRGVGDKNPNWRGGISSEIKKRYMGHDWKLIRKEVLIRYNFQCVDCGKKAILDIHHIIPYRIVKEHKIENLIPLCKSCHIRREWEYNQEAKKNAKT